MTTRIKFFRGDHEEMETMINSWLSQFEHITIGLITHTTSNGMDNVFLVFDI